MRYEVAIGKEKVSDVPGPPGGPKVIAIDADLKATLSKLHTDKSNFTPVKSIVVKSRFNMTADPHAGKTAKELTAVEQAARDKAAADFLKKPDVNPAPGTAGQSNESRELPLPPPSVAGPASFQQVKVDPSLVQLSAAKGKGPETVLLPGVLAALAELAKPAPQAPPFAGAWGLRDRLAAAQIGTTQLDVVIGLGQRPALATKAAAPGGNNAVSALLSADEREALRQISGSDAATRILAVLARMTEEKKAGDRLAGPGNTLTKAYLAARMEIARRTERQALAGLVAAAYGTRTEARRVMQDFGPRDLDKPFHVSVRTKVLALAP